RRRAAGARVTLCVPGALQHVVLLRRPGIARNSAPAPAMPPLGVSNDPGPAVHRSARAIAREDARKRAYGAAPHPGNRGCGGRVEALTWPRTRRAPSPHWGGGWGEGHENLGKPSPPCPTCIASLASRSRIKSGTGSLATGERWSKRLCRVSPRLSGEIDSRVCYAALLGEGSVSQSHASIFDHG